MEFNKEFKQALHLMGETSRSVFVTGRAGTGKSTLLKYFKDTTAKNAVVLAPTGVAAVNACGQTIHSFFGFRPDITVAKARQKKPRRGREKLYKKLDTIVIDEISMVRADLFDCVEAFMRQHGPKPGQPFGGVQIVVIGDLYQLAPIVTREEKEAFAAAYSTPYFFSAAAFAALKPEMVELRKVYRQKEDPVLLGILNAVRNHTLTEEHLHNLNQRHLSGEEMDAASVGSVRLTTTNAAAKQVNDKELAQLSSRAFHSQGVVTGKFEERSLPAPLDLELRSGAQVMLVSNDPGGRWVNGTVGAVTSVPDAANGAGRVRVRLNDGPEVALDRYSWDTYEYVYNAEEGSVEATQVGSYTQYPLILAWAVTIHKSQGKTFEKAVIDFGRGTFAHGQAYVALSRCTTLGGIALKQPFKKSFIRLDWDVVRFLAEYQ